MKLEDKACVDLVKEKKLGKVSFVRYSLSLNKQHDGKLDMILSELYTWFEEMGMKEVKELSVSLGKGGQVLLVTGQFEGAILFNIFINLTQTTDGFVKKLEVAGTDGLYVFNSESEEAFVSSCIPKKDYEFEEVTAKSQTWRESILSQVVKGGNS